MINMEIDMVSSLNINKFCREETDKSRSFLAELEEQLAHVAKMIERIFEGVCTESLNQSEISSITNQEAFVLHRLKNFYTSLLEVLDCFNPDRKTSGSCLITTGSTESERRNSEKSKSSLSFISSLSQESINHLIQKAVVNGGDRNSSQAKHSNQSRKNSKRFVTTAVTGAEIAAAYHTLAAATFRMSDWLFMGRQEKTRHSSFVSRGTSTPRIKEDSIPWFMSPSQQLTQSLPSLPPHFETTIMGISNPSQDQDQIVLSPEQLIFSTPATTSPPTNLQQQQTQTTLATKDASTSPDGIPKEDKAVQVRHGEILEPVDKFHPPSRYDRHKRRQNVQSVLHRIVEESEEDEEYSCNNRKVARKSDSTSSSDLTTSSFSRRQFCCTFESKMTCNHRFKGNANPGVVSEYQGDYQSYQCNYSSENCTDSHILNLDTPRPQFKTIEYFFTTKP